MIVNEPGRDTLSKILVDEEEDHDGWGPIRPRRSSMPPDDLHCAAGRERREPLGEPPIQPSQTPTRR
jgi:hypothetical protein